MIFINFVDNIDNNGEVLKTWFNSWRTFQDFLNNYENVLEYTYFNYDIIKEIVNKEKLKERVFLNVNHKRFKIFFKFLFREISLKELKEVLKWNLQNLV